MGTATAGGCANCGCCCCCCHPCCFLLLLRRCCCCCCCRPFHLACSASGTAIGACACGTSLDRPHRRDLLPCGRRDLDLDRDPLRRIATWGANRRDGTAPGCCRCYCCCCCCRCRCHRVVGGRAIATAGLLHHPVRPGSRGQTRPRPCRLRFAFCVLRCVALRFMRCVGLRFFDSRMNRTAVVAVWLGVDRSIDRLVFVCCFVSFRFV
mmetsp:Transcript_4984/g.11583  ORF Transcript_4984/g.11583 Transcript_4984/m.11583 type:complete len:208 (+) Transcript_4984:1433-2056(+)